MKTQENYYFMVGVFTEYLSIILHRLSRLRHSEGPDP
ncbi:hypothetical protein QF023_003154 [Chryseobacterium sp. SLBN-27]|nr:hypothetical protein [Chryseobacterium sp. SLBN-27]